MTVHPASFRDRAGAVFTHNGVLFRRISVIGRPDYEFLMASGLYQKLSDADHIVSHVEVGQETAPPGLEWSDGELIIQPDLVSVLVYPYEWCFSQFREAALLTLDTCLDAIQSGMILKDATPFNVQLKSGRCLFIDTLSFTKYHEGEPWVAYRQFIQNFLVPLLLMSKVSPDLNSLLSVYLNGIPLNVAKAMLPRRSALNPLIFLNVYLHANYETKFADVREKPRVKLSRAQLVNSLKLLRKMVEGLSLHQSKTTWSNYYQETNYTSDSLAAKHQQVLRLVKSVGGKFDRILDLGANNGTFSRLVSPLASMVISADIDPLAVDANYHINRSHGITNIVPLRIDFTNPSTSLGWACRERDSFFARCQADLTICLAFIHHMVISANVPFYEVARALTLLSPNLIIEFPDRGDSQVVRLLAQKPENHEYNVEAFEQAFDAYFETQEKVNVQGTKRSLYRMTRRQQ